MFEEVPVQLSRSGRLRSRWRWARLLTALLAFLVLAAQAPLSGAERAAAQGPAAAVSVPELSAVGHPPAAQGAGPVAPLAVTSQRIGGAGPEPISLVIVVATALAIGGLVLGSGRYARLDRRRSSTGRAPLAGASPPN